MIVAFEPVELALMFTAVRAFDTAVAVADDNVPGSSVTLTDPVPELIPVEVTEVGEYVIVALLGILVKVGADVTCPAAAAAWAAATCVTAW